MTAELEVFHSGEFIGHLVEEVGGQWGFVYNSKFLQSKPTRKMLSLNFPLRETPYRGGDLTAVFRNLLPDGDLRRQLAHKIGVSVGNDFALLGAIAGDCPGALSLLVPGEQWHGDGEVRTLTEPELRNVVAALPTHPLLLEVEGARFTLPGEHHKIPVRVVSGQLALTLGNTLSSHIAKPAKIGLRESVMNEGFCLELSRELGLPTANATVRHGPATVLLIERLDREQLDIGWVAIHMEDFAQLMGVPPEQKYQREGGLSAADCIDCIKRYSMMPAADMRSFLRWLVFCYLVGNGGGHAKQLSICHLATGPRLSPFYGLMSTHIYPALNQRMAMSIGNEDRPDWIIPARWREFASQADIKGTYVLAIVRELAEQAPRIGAWVAERFQREHGFASVIRDIRSLIEQRSRQILVSLEAELL